MGGCGVTNTMYGNKVADVVDGLYGKGPEGAVGELPKMRAGGRKTRKMKGGYAGCTGQPTMLRALGIMGGGSKRRMARTQKAGGCGCGGVPRFLKGGQRLQRLRRSNCSTRKYRK